MPTADGRPIAHYGKKWDDAVGQIVVWCGLLAGILGLDSYTNDPDKVTCEACRARAKLGKPRIPV